MLLKFYRFIHLCVYIYVRICTSTPLYACFFVFEIFLNKKKKLLGTKGLKKIKIKTKTNVNPINDLILI